MAQAHYSIVTEAEHRGWLATLDPEQEAWIFRLHDFDGQQRGGAEQYASIETATEYMQGEYGDEWAGWLPVPKGRDSLAWARSHRELPG